MNPYFFSLLMNAASLFFYQGSCMGCFHAGLQVKHALKLPPWSAGIVAEQRRATFCKRQILLG